MEVNKPGDKFEQEADKMAEKVMRMPAPATSATEDRLQRNTDERLQKSEEDKLQKKDDERLQKADAPEDRLQKQDDEKLQREPASEEKLQRDGVGAPAVPSGAQSAIQGKTGGGQPLSSDVRSFMEPRFNADFSKVRVHHDAESATLNSDLSARAFTYRKHIFFSRDQYQPGTSEGRQLLAHELTHTIQQGHAVQRSPQVSRAPATPAVQRTWYDPRTWHVSLPIPGLQSALNWIADKANIIPGYRLLTVLMGFNPINGKSVDKSAANILRAAIEVIPVVGHVITRVLDAHSLTNKVAAWFERKMAVFSNIVGRIGAAWDKFKGTIGADDIIHPIRAWERAKAIFTGPIGQLKTFIGGTVSEILKMVKDAILKPLAALARKGMPNAYDLLVGLLGKDPITDEAVHPSAEMLIGGFLKLIHQDEIFENMKKSHAIPRAVAWFHHAVAGVKAIALSIPGRVVAALNALTFPDVLTVVGAFTKIGGCFLGIAGDFLSFAGSAMWNLLEIIFDVLAPGTIGYLRKTGAALKGILKNPMPFMHNLVAAAKLGLNNFKNHFWTHLKNGLLSWLTGSLDGVYLPKALTLVEMGKFALSVLGISWAHIRAKIVKALGPRGEQIMQGLEKTFDVIKTLVTGGPAALWELIKQKLTDLKDQVIHGIISFVTVTIVEKAIPKLVAMFIPGAGFISAIITIYDTITTVKRQLSRIWAVVTGFLNSIVAIASGHISSAANRVEGILANLISLAINFLAGFLGLGKVTNKINSVLQKLRAPVDKALDVGIEWIVGKARAFASRALGGDPNAPPQERLENGIREAVMAVNKLSGGRIGLAVLRPVLFAIKSRHNMQSLEAESRGGRWAVVGVVNPHGESLTEKLVDDQTAGAERREYDGVNAAGFGTGARVTGLRELRAPNQPSVSSGTWSTLLKRKNRDGGASYYVAGHLINGTFGGPGSDWRNLTPLTQRANNSSIESMLHTFENPVRNAIRDHARVDLSVNAVYGQPSRAEDVKRAKGLEPAEKGRDIAELIGAEALIPSEIQSAATITESSGAVRRLSSTTLNVVDTDLTHYFHVNWQGAGARRFVNVNTAQADTLKTLVGVDDGIARRIVENRPYSNAVNLTAKLGADGGAIFQRMVSTAGVSLRY